MVLPSDAGQNSGTADAVDEDAQARAGVSPSGSDSESSPESSPTQSELGYYHGTIDDSAGRWNEVLNSRELTPRYITFTVVHPGSSIPTPWRLPLHLPRSQHQEINPSILAAVDSTAVAVPIHAYRQKLALDTYYFRQANLHSRVIPSSDNPLLNSVRVELGRMVLDMIPTHVLAVYPDERMRQFPSPSPPPPATASLFFVHAKVLVANCARLPIPPPQLHFPLTESELEVDPTLDIKVWNMVVPFPEAFEMFLDCVYARDTRRLMLLLLPLSPEEAIVIYPISVDSRYTKADFTRAVRAYAARLARSYPIPEINSLIFKVQALYANADALGFYDNTMFAAIDAMWQVLLMTMALATGDVNLAEELSPAREDGESSGFDVDASEK
ncbi:hypothetical protein D9613_004355 [Agrocybe pediades]|uniref:Uncharacterized protein n=1 Tax=Agrocybe pediades TaxID=84607 RepID=A0A8H4QK46_9AGAR|nr:hypothetical protein D9613_004355 [Agrocybe pediades]